MLRCHCNIYFLINISKGIVMKYQQLENLEAGWKWNYLLKKSRENENITRYIDNSAIEIAVQELEQMAHDPTLVLPWIDEHISADVHHKLRQAIRAKRKRHFNAEQIHTRKKSIDLDYRVWEKLAEKAQELDATLSDTIEYLITETNRGSKIDNKVNALKKDLTKLLDI